jgi:hypothetical protein
MPESGPNRKDYNTVTRRTRLEQRRPIFTLRLEAKPGTDAVRSLRLALKFLLRRFHLRCVSCVEDRGRR